MTATQPGSGESVEVTPSEACFDLVFLFAVSQLSGHLAENLTLVRAAQTLVLLLTAFLVWSFATYEATMVLARSSRTQWFVVALMVGAFAMNVAIPGAFGH